MSGRGCQSLRLARARRWIGSPWTWLLLALSIVWLAEAMDVRVGGGHSYRGSRRSSGGVSFGSGSGVSGDAGLLLMELIRLFLWLPWPLRLVMIAVIIGLIIRVNYAGWQVSYSSFQTGWPSGASGVLLTSPAYRRPSVSGRSGSIPRSARCSSWSAPCCS